MEKTTELYEQITKLFADFQANHEKFVEKGNKAAAGRARKHLGEIKKLVTEYRKVSVEDCK